MGEEQTMSDDSISRQAATQTALEFIVEYLGGAFDEDFQRKLIERMNALPSADRPQGEWIDIGTISHSYKCSVCGRTLFHITVGKSHVAKHYPYCHCGARMKGADDENY
jgi:DNA-directed RNA polymerase subunit RPC12/RpoP